MKRTTLVGSLFLVRSLEHNKQLSVGGARMWLKLLPIFAPKESKSGVPSLAVILLSSFKSTKASSILNSTRTISTSSSRRVGRSLSASVLKIRNSKTRSMLVEFLRTLSKYLPLVSFSFSASKAAAIGPKYSSFSSSNLSNSLDIFDTLSSIACPFLLLAMLTSRVTMCNWKCIKTTA